MTSKLPLPRKLSTHTSFLTPARKASGISVSKAASKPNFLNKKPQVVNDMGEERTVVYVGNDPISGVQLYAFKDPDGHLDGGDPRGMLGRHATDWLVAKEYDMEGEDVAFSWLTLNDNKANYDRAIEYAKRKWTGGAAKSARPSFRKRYALGVRKSDVDPAVEKAGDAADRAGYNTRMSAKGLTIMGCKVEDAKKALGGLASKFSLKQDGNNVAATLNVAAAARAGMSKAGYVGDEDSTRVTFKYEEGSKDDVYAVLWDYGQGRNGRFTIYAHMGQHSEADLGYINSTKTAPESDKNVQDLKRELEGLGYKLTVVPRKPSDPGGPNNGQKAKTAAERPEMRKLSLNDQRLVAKMVADMKKAKRHYAWDKCVADAKKNGADDPEAVCASIARGSGLKNEVKGKAAEPIVLKSLSELKRIAIVEPDPRIRAGYAEELAKRMSGPDAAAPDDEEELYGE